ncbi:GAL4-like Zn(II)2Cys6 (or C6 zinc) binuclear cluster DNA-binding domain [Teratosphaeria destructans]|uniref:GAL4-like Zn(II)2Cys6 (Or C6 zinc) binuclear cluster DNA-binding domain n=1 Tax=Teratosphaeria destructans TaxID=418781 RepID=A0A9W7STP3_9PEZI|nr:GAL4-like Zn(II)2Cys6 (or C6 zinc) binuclear cluster DNA-binding domain [Teratosphaeria destructans]
MFDRQLIDVVAVKLYAEYDAAFVQPDEYVTRGQHFHEEALRLWVLENGQANVANLQALLILTLDSSWRGKDKFGVMLLTVALQMNKDIPMVAGAGSDSLSDTARARTCAAWATHFIDVTCSIALLKVNSPIDSRLSFVPMLPDTNSFWTGRPLNHLSTQYRGNALFRERCILTRLISDVNDLLFSKESVQTASFEEDARQLEGRLTAWYQNLPSDIQYNKDLPAPIFDLHGNYLCVMLTLCATAERMILSPSSDSAAPAPNGNEASERRPDSPAVYWNTGTLQHATQAATVVRDFRTTYGMKMTLAFVFQCAVISSFTLIQYLNGSDELAAAPISPANTLTSPAAAFEETFRCVLGAATHVMIARGACRMIDRTMQMKQVAMPPRVTRMMAGIEQLTWQASDLEHISSTYPNYGVLADSTHGDSVEMERLLKEWEVMSL